jgi:hypothetical protein
LVLVSCPLIEKFSAIEEGRESLAIATLSFLLLLELAVLSRSQRE